MKQPGWWVAGVLALMCAFALGNWTSRSTPVHAAGSDLQFQLHSVESNNSLLIYSPSQNAIYVYQGANAGASNLQCSYRFMLGAPGGAIKRQNCEVHSFIP